MLLWQHTWYINNCKWHVVLLPSTRQPLVRSYVKQKSHLCTACVKRIIVLWEFSKIVSFVYIYFGLTNLQCIVALWNVIYRSSLYVDQLSHEHDHIRSSLMKYSLKKAQYSHHKHLHNFVYYWIFHYSQYINASVQNLKYAINDIIWLKYMSHMWLCYTNMEDRHTTFL